ncbi:uncharacterized mitochondrial protein AtMg00810-like [Lycium ferocissimum]|uniref:uncharacterized mitochondrial protein AtMg00810-like n=1 Tax=Lycium ferocissimum TaxID=112874 RepID=UPI002815E6C6|nr:uncharacterized mitochondrial protein AtMg00810-like [Lycium ferocissimum]
MDVHNTFLQGDLSKKVYMVLPLGFQWQGEYKGMPESSYDHSLFTKKDGLDVVIVLVYVDDLLLTGSSMKLIQELKSVLHRHFKMKDLGDLKSFLGIEVLRSKSGILLTQRKYALELISDSGLGGAKVASTPLEQNVKLTTVDHDEYTGKLDDPPLKDITGYLRLVGSLLYLTITRPDISFTVQMLSQFMQQPKASHWEAALRLIRYIKRSPGQGLFLSSDSDAQLSAYCDSDWAACPNTTRSVTGYVVKLGNSLISWK